MTDDGDALVLDGVSRAGERDLFGLEHHGPGQASFELTARRARFDGRLFGGTAIGVAVALAEAATERSAIWTTVQFVSAAAQVGDRIHCTTEVLALGASAAQVRIVARVGDQEVFGAVATTARRKEGRIEGTFEAFPAVVPPTEAPAFPLPLPRGLVAKADQLQRTFEMRSATPLDRGSLPSDHLTLWARVPGRAATPAILAYLADMVPLSIVRAAGRAGGGTSLDNTMRFGRPSEDEWVLLQLVPHLATGGYGHGSVLLWSPAGELVATGSQTTALLVID